MMLHTTDGAVRLRDEMICYRVDLGDAFLSDALLAQTHMECERVARAAAVDGDVARAAKITCMSLQMGLGEEKNSHVYMVTQGEIATSTLSGFTVGGRRLNAYEVAAV